MSTCYFVFFREMWRRAGHAPFPWCLQQLVCVHHWLRSWIRQTEQKRRWAELTHVHTHAPRHTLNPKHVFGIAGPLKSLVSVFCTRAKVKNDHRTSSVISGCIPPVCCIFVPQGHASRLYSSIIFGSTTFQPNCISIFFVMNKISTYQKARLCGFESISSTSECKACS